MNKRAFIGLAVAPVILATSAFWVRKLAWQRKDEEFRRDVLRYARTLAAPQRSASFQVYVHRLKGGDPDFLGCWGEPRMKHFLADVHLSPMQRNHHETVPIYAIYFESPIIGRSLGISLDVQKNQGTYDFSPHPNLSPKWQDFQFTPASALALKKQFWLDFGPKLRALHMPPPQ